MRPLRPMILSAMLTLAVGLPGLLAPAEAFWPFDRWFSKDRPETGTAPPVADAVEAECGPILQKIRELNQTHRVAHPFVRPRIGLLKREYYDCVYRINQQEYEYLKRAEIEIPEAAEKPGETPQKQQPAPDLPPLDPPAEN